MRTSPFAPRHRHAPSGDADLLRAVRDGDGAAFRTLRQRHRVAVHAYALSCTPRPDLAAALVEGAFGGLHDRIVSAGPLYEGRHAACVRLQLLESVRIDAVARAVRAPAAFGPGFVRWLDGGATWPLTAEGHGLAVAFERLAPGLRCLLWHGVVEGDGPDVLGGISGLSRADAQTALALAQASFRRTRASLGAERAGGRDCAALRDRLLDPQGPLRPRVPRHLYTCARCWSLYEDLGDLDRRTRFSLPARLLGWWPAPEYHRLKERAVPRPVVPRRGGGAVERGASSRHRTQRPSPQAPRLSSRSGGSRRSAVAPPAVCSGGAERVVGPVRRHEARPGAPVRRSRGRAGAVWRRTYVVRAVIVGLLVGGTLAAALVGLLVDERDIGVRGGGWETLLP
ncbi:hypothetical protein ACIPPJ_25335 [Streptomyces sp. NPDC086091]|uniref:hypothetical protein n=1 Tax=Streptomyces sp. NPDC086091 TaxID=3365751 RepID=UPI0037F12878